MRRIALMLFLGCLGAAQAQPALLPLRPVECSFNLEGREIFSGSCELSSDEAGSFVLYSRDHLVRGEVAGRDARAVEWNPIPGDVAQWENVGRVSRRGDCWRSATVSICIRELDAARREAIMRTWPGGQAIAPVDTTRNLCVTVPERRFEPDAPLVLDACDGMRAVRDRVFAREDDRLTLAGRPEVCIGVQEPSGRLVLEPCGPNALRWSFDDDAQMVRSSTGLCWRLPPGYARARHPVTMDAVACGAPGADLPKLWMIGD